MKKNFVCHYFIQNNITSIKFNNLCPMTMFIPYCKTCPHKQNTTYFQVNSYPIYRIKLIKETCVSYNNARI